MSLLLRVGSLLLPAAHRARWREELQAMLLDVPAPRRYRYALDVLVKLPLLGLQLRRADRRGRGGRSGRMAALGPLLSAAAVIGALTLPPLIGEDAAEALFLLAPVALLPLLAREALAFRHRAAAVSALVLGACGPLVAIAVVTAGPALPASLRPAASLAGHALLAGPGVLLATACGRAALRPGAPVLRHALGFGAGAALVIGVAGLVLQLSAGPGLLASLLMVAGLLLFLVTFLPWALWSGAAAVRLAPLA